MPYNLSSISPPPPVSEWGRDRRRSPARGPGRRRGDAAHSRGASSSFIAFYNAGPARATYPSSWSKSTPPLPAPQPDAASGGAANARPPIVVFMAGRLCAGRSKLGGCLKTPIIVFAHYTQPCPLRRGSCGGTGMAMERTLTAIDVCALSCLKPLDRVVNQI